MAITYVNDLRLSEMDTGDNSGTWGTVTNTNLELIGEALGFGTEAITTNADTHASTIVDGSTDPVRAMYVKYTGTLDSACTITIGPNTVNKFYYIENATSGSQNIIISQGSGANVTIPAGDVKAVYLDGAGSGAAVTDAFASLNVVDLKVQDDLTVTDDMTVGGTLGVTGVLTATSLDISGDIDVDGTTNLDVTNIVGDLTVTGDTITFTSANANDPALKLINTTNDTDGAELQIRKDKGAAGADGDIVGLISFIGDDAAQQQTIFAKMTASIATAADGSEGGKLAIGLATHDAEFQDGLVLQDGNAEDEIDVTIGSGTSSATTIAGDIKVTGKILNVGATDFTIDVSQDLSFDSGHGDFYFKDTGTSFLNIYESSSNAYILMPTNNQDLIIQGIDDGAGVDALRFDMSDGGTATFRKKVIVSAADGVADADYVGSFSNLESTSGRSFGVSITAGTSTADLALNVVNRAADTALLRVDGVGNTSINGTIKSLGGGLISSDGTGDTLVISGSNAVNTGGNITLEGNAATDASQIKFKNGSTEVMRVAGGKLLVGTDVANGESSNTIPVRAGIFSTQSGATSSNTSTATTLMTFGSNEGNFLVSARGSGTGATTDNTTGIVHINNSASTYTVLSAGSRVVLSMSGLNLQVTQTMFNSASVTWNVIRIG